MTQFADDTTFILDGSQHSLQSAVNTIEIYGSMSGLKGIRRRPRLFGLDEKDILGKN